MITVGTHAPSVNFETTTTSVTTAVAAAPTALMASRRGQPDSRRRQWCTTMPACERVNAKNRPTANSGMSALTSPPNATSRVPAATASTSIPFDRTSRSPRFASWRGRKPSVATMPARRGKSANAVLAESVRIIAVDACNSQYSGPVPKTA